jgi:hypothetical protein
MQIQSDGEEVKEGEVRVFCFFVLEEEVRKKKKEGRRKKEEGRQRRETEKQESFSSYLSFLFHRLFIIRVIIPVISSRSGNDFVFNVIET